MYTRPALIEHIEPKELEAALAEIEVPHITGIQSLHNTVSNRVLALLVLCKGTFVSSPAF
jgi:hypothetical protein